MEKRIPLAKDTGRTLELLALAIAVADSLEHGALRRLLWFLRQIGLPRNEILRLRLDEPEFVSDMLDQYEVEITAVRMAKEAGIDPKRLRAALRKEKFSWHGHNDRWTVRRDGAEHRDMQHVLSGLLGQNKVG